MSVNRYWLKLHESANRLKGLISLIEAETEVNSPVFQGMLEIAIADLETIKVQSVHQIPAVITSCVFFSYSHGQITEGEASSILGMNRIDFRDRWQSYLKANPEIAKATGWDAHLASQPTEPAAGIPFFSRK